MAVGGSTVVVPVGVGVKVATGVGGSTVVFGVGVAVGGSPVVFGVGVMVGVSVNVQIGRAHV